MFTAIVLQLNGHARKWRFRVLSATTRGQNISTEGRTTWPNAVYNYVSHCITMYGL